MFKFIARRMLETIPVLFIIITGSFFMIHAAPGGPFDSERRMSPEIQRNLEAYYGLDKPLYAAIPHLHGQARVSRRPGAVVQVRQPHGQRTHRRVAARFVGTGLLRDVIAIVIGVTAGIIASLRPNTATDYVPMSLAMAGICLPTFVLGPLLVLCFALYKAVALPAIAQIALIALPAALLAFVAWRWRTRPLPAAGGLLTGGLLGWGLVLFITSDHQWFYPSGWNFAADRVLPALTLGIYYAAYLARLTRGGMLEILCQDLHPHRARQGGGRGARHPQARVARRAAAGGQFLRPGAGGDHQRVVRGGNDFPDSGAGSVFRHRRAFNRDYTMVMGTVIFFAVLIMFFNLLVDVAPGVSESAAAIRVNLRASILAAHARTRRGQKDRGTASAPPAEPAEPESGSSLWRDAWHRLLKNKLAVVGGGLHPRGRAALHVSRPASRRPQRAGPALYASRAQPRALVRHGHRSGATSSRACSSAGASRWRSASWPRLVALCIGVVYGTVSGFYGGNVDAVMMRIVDIIYALPFTIFVILLSGFQQRRPRRINRLHVSAA